MIVLRQLLDRLCANWSSSCKSFFTLREKSVNYPVKKVETAVETAFPEIPDRVILRHDPGSGLGLSLTAPAQ